MQAVVAEPETSPPKPYQMKEPGANNLVGELLRLIIPKSFTRASAAEFEGDTARITFTTDAREMQLPEKENKLPIDFLGIRPEKDQYVATFARKESITHPFVIVAKEGFHQTVRNLTAPHPNKSALDPVTTLNVGLTYKVPLGAWHAFPPELIAAISGFTLRQNEKGICWPGREYNHRHDREGTPDPKQIQLAYNGYGEENKKVMEELANNLRNMGLIRREITDPPKGSSPTTTKYFLAVPHLNTELIAAFERHVRALPSGEHSHYADGAVLTFNAKGLESKLIAGVPSLFDASLESPNSFVGVEGLYTIHPAYGNTEIYTRTLEQAAKLSANIENHGVGIKPGYQRQRFDMSPLNVR